MHLASPTSPTHVAASSDVMRKSFSATCYGVSCIMRVRGTGNPGEFRCREAGNGYHERGDGLFRYDLNSDKLRQRSMRWLNRSRR